MKRLTFLLGLFLIVNMGCSKEDIVLNTEREKLSYAVGMDIAKNLERQNLELEPDIVARGMRDLLTAKEPLMTDKEYHDSMVGLMKEMEHRQIAGKKEDSEKNRKDGEAFLAENSRKEGVVTMPNGLQYKVIKAGTGRTPKSTDTVIVNYAGKLIDGTEFDSSFRRGEAAHFKVNGVINGWRGALQLMKEGAQWELYIPSKLAYGMHGSGRDIGPNATLIFYLELVSIKEEAAGMEK